MIFCVQDEQPMWPSDSDDNISLESVSEPDDITFDDEDDVGDEDNEDDVGDGDDIEDDWVDPSLPTPTAICPLPKPSQQQRQQQQPPQPQPPPIPKKDHLSPSHSSSSSSSPSAPPMLKSKASSSKKSNSTLNNSVKMTKSKKQIPVPVPSVTLSTQEQHYPFPVTPIDDPSGSSPHHATTPQDRGQGKWTPNEKRMHTARARDEKRIKYMMDGCGMLRHECLIDPLYMQQLSILSSCWMKLMKGLLRLMSCLG